MKTIRIIQTKVEGELARRIDVTACKMVHHIDVEKNFTRHFKYPVEKPEIRSGFVGYGMFLDALVKAAAVLRTPELIAYKKQLFSELAATMRPDGRISIYADGFSGNWDTHESAYLLTAYNNDWLLFHEYRSLETALRLGNYLIKHHVKTTIGIETGLLLLYESTGEQVFLDYCRDELKLDSPPEVYEKILAVNNINHVYTFLARAVAQLKYAELTGRYTGNILAGAENALHRILDQGYVSISGCCTGPGREECEWGEVWDDTQRGTGKWGETCATAYLLRLAAAWQKIRPSARISDLLERVTYNAFFAAQSIDGMRQRYFLSHEEPRSWYDDEYYCCPNNFRRMMFELPAAQFSTCRDALVINFHAAGSAKVNVAGAEVKIALHGDYPYDSRMELTVDAPKSVTFTLLIPVPKWCEDFSAWGGGHRFTAKPGSFLEIRREWCGQIQFHLLFPMKVRLVRGREAQKERVALLRGPLLYAYNRKWNGKSPDEVMLDAERPIIYAEGTLRAFDIDGNTLVFTPFGDPDAERTYLHVAGGEKLIGDDELFRVQTELTISEAELETEAVFR